MFGLPGAGKTTISVPIIKRLREEGYRVADLTDVYFRNCDKGGKIRVLLEILLSGKYYPLYINFIRYGLSVTKNQDRLKYLIKLLIFIHQLVKTIEEGKYEIALCEEGVIQHLSSLCYDCELPDTELLGICISKLIKLANIKAINCEIDLEESLSRINKRGEKTSRRFSSRSNSESLRSILYAKGQNLALVANYIPTLYTLSMEQSIVINQNILYSIIRKELN